MSESPAHQRVHHQAEEGGGWEEWPRKELLSRRRGGASGTTYGHEEFQSRSNLWNKKLLPREGVEVEGVGVEVVYRRWGGRRYWLTCGAAHATAAGAGIGQAGSSALHADGPGPVPPVGGPKAGKPRGFRGGPWKKPCLPLPLGRLRALAVLLSGSLAWRTGPAAVAGEGVGGQVEKGQHHSLGTWIRDAELQGLWTGEWEMREGRGGGIWVETSTAFAGATATGWRWCGATAAGAVAVEGKKTMTMEARLVRGPRVVEAGPSISRSTNSRNGDHGNSRATHNLAGGKLRRMGKEAAAAKETKGSTVARPRNPGTFRPYAWWPCPPGLEWLLPRASRRPRTRWEDYRRGVLVRRNSTERERPESAWLENCGRQAAQRRKLSPSVSKERMTKLRGPSELCVERLRRRGRKKPASQPYKRSWWKTKRKSHAIGNAFRPRGSTGSTWQPRSSLRSPSARYNTSERSPRRCRRKTRNKPRRRPGRCGRCSSAHGKMRWIWRGGDTDSAEEETGGGTDLASDGAATDRTRLDLVSHEGTKEEVGEGNEELLRELAEARSRLEAIQREQSEALSRVVGPLGGENKRNLAGECKGGDQDGDVDMVPPLTALQVSAMFSERLRNAENQVRHYQVLLAREEVLPPRASGAEGTVVPKQPLLMRAPSASSQAADRGRTEEQGAGGGGGGGGPDQGGTRGRPRRRPGHETWVTAEERDEAVAEAERRQLQRGEQRQHLQRPRTASREEGPGRGRWSAGAAKAAGGRQRSVGHRATCAEGWAEVEREFRRQQRAGEDLESRVRDHLQVAEQERMQQVQEAERRETARAKAAAAARELEATLAGGPGEAAPRGATVPCTGDGEGQLAPTYGPTGQRLDEQQLLLRVAAAGAAAERAGMAARPPSVPRRKTRWGDDSEVEEDGARERSQRGARGQRGVRGAMEN